MTRRPGRPPGTHPPARLTVLVSFRIEPVTAARIERERRDGESRDTAARRILVDAMNSKDDSSMTAPIFWPFSLLNWRPKPGDKVQHDQGWIADIVERPTDADPGVLPDAFWFVHPNSGTVQSIAPDVFAERFGPHPNKDWWMAAQASGEKKP